MDYELYDLLTEMGIATEEELALVCTMNGMNTDTLERVLFIRTGYRSLDQFLESEAEEV